MTSKRLVAVLTVSILPLLASSAFGQTYEVPPSTISSSSVPYIRLCYGTVRDFIQ